MHTPNTARPASSSLIIDPGGDPATPMRTLARKVRDAARASYRHMLLRSALSQLNDCARAGNAPDAKLIARLVRGWGNEAWSADQPLLTGMLEWLPKTSGTIVECGSGLSTLVLGTAAAVSGRRVFSFEHDSQWAARVERSVPTHLRGTIELCVTPMCTHSDFDWYSLEGVRLPNDIGFVLCDGPPGGTRGGRYGLGPILMPLLAPGCLVLVDDTRRAAEQHIVDEWCAQFGAAVVHRGSTYHVLEVR